MIIVWHLIDENTPQDRPILVGAECEPNRWYPFGFEAAVVKWYPFKAAWKPELKGWWALTDVPQGACDNACGFEPTHWAEITDLRGKPLEEVK